ncbi:MAG: hypothetical protein M1830_000077 [Pleopsidium flavum]|nr:MAG: hypothetical protein M1830_000077 [Pleopsidium flavum]
MCSSPLFSQNFQRIAQHILQHNKSQIKPTIILVHGGWQGPEVFTNLVPCLEKAGYSVFAPRLPSSGTIPALPDFDEDVKVVHSAIQSVIDTGKEVVVAMHSYGAVVGCEALKGLKIKDGAGSEGSVESHDSGGVVRLAFITGMILQEGGSIWEREKGNVPIPGFEYQDNLITILDAPSRFYNDLPERAANYWSSKLKPQSRSAYSSQLTYAAWRYIPSSYLLCTNDNALPLKVQERMVRMAGIQETSRVDTGHTPHVSQPGIVAAFIRKAAGEYPSIL